jgi:hypothetical protein
MNLVEIRKNGIGNGFTVINPKDGFRKDNRLWFGECATCGESVSSSSMSANNVGWVHSVVVGTIGTTGKIVKSVDYCPKVGE